MSMYLRTRYFPPRGSKFKIQSTYSYAQYPQNWAFVSSISSKVRRSLFRAAVLRMARIFGSARVVQ